MVFRGSKDRSFKDYRSDSAVAATGWPHDVLEQWPFEHLDNAGFKDDYGSINPRDVVGRLEIVTAEELSEMPTGDADAGCIEEFSRDPDHWSGNRGPDVSRYWETSVPGTGANGRISDQPHCQPARPPSTSHITYFAPGQRPQPSRGNRVG